MSRPHLVAVPTREVLPGTVSRPTRSIGASAASPEERLADRFAGNVSAPVDVDFLLRELAEVKTVPFPRGLDVDAVTISPRGGQSSHVLLNGRREIQSRLLFTKAHELAHLVIPWHVGTVACSIDRDDDDPQRSWAATHEYEANRFAARLLIPQRWLVEHVIPSPDPDEMFCQLENAGTSALPAVLRLHAELPAGWLIRLESTLHNDAQEWVSPGTLAKRHFPASTAGTRIADAQGRYRFGARTITWWRWQPIEPGYPVLPEIGAGVRRPTVDVVRGQLKTFATERLRELFGSFPDAEHRLIRFAGSCSSTRDKVAVRTPSALYSALRQRFCEEAEFGIPITDTRLLGVLAAKAWQWSSSPVQPRPSA